MAWKNWLLAGGYPTDFRFGMRGLGTMMGFRVWGLGYHDGVLIPGGMPVVASLV